MTTPNNVNLTDKEYKDITALLNAFGYQFVYVNPNAYIGNIGNMVLGLNICKNIKAAEAGIVLSEEDKQEIMRILREKADRRLFGWKKKTGSASRTFLIGYVISSMIQDSSVVMWCFAAYQEFP